MRTKLSSKGQAVIPEPIRRTLALSPGDSLEARVEGDCVVLVPSKKPVRKGRIITDPVTRLPVLTGGPKASRLTSNQVRQALDEFP